MAERDELRIRLEAAIAERDAGVIERDNFRIQLHAAVAERDAYRSLLDAAVNKCNELQGQLDALAVHSEELQLHSDGAVADQHSSVEEKEISAEPEPEANVRMQCCNKTHA